MFPVLYPFQFDGVKALKDNPKFILADDMGLGKTVQAVKAAAELKCGRVLVVCPHVMRGTWCKKINEYLPFTQIKEIISSKSIVANIPHWCVVNYDLVWRKGIKEVLAPIPWDLIILDEAHYLKGIKSKRTNAILGRLGLVLSVPRVWCLTGTPMLNRPVELFPILKSLFPQTIKKYSSYFEFTKRYCSAYQGRFGWDATGVSNEKELYASINSIYLRRMRTEVLPQLPTATITEISLTADSCMRAMLAREKTLNRSDIAEKMAASEIISLRRQIGIMKLPACIEFINGTLEKVDKVVVFTYHRDVAAGLQAEYKEACVLCTGDQNGAQKDAAIDSFIHNKSVTLFIAQIEAGGQGIDGLQHVCHTVIFAELTYVPGKLDQAIDRLVRIGQENPVDAYFLVHENSVDSDILQIIKRKRKVIKSLIKSEHEALVAAGL